jgi:hypothetical protein
MQSSSCKLFTAPLPSRYLVQGSQGSILHTGDFRAEPSFLKSVADDLFLKPFLAQGGNQTLDAIYMDTACVWSSSEPPSKVCPHAYLPYSTCEFTCFHSYRRLQRTALSTSWVVSPLQRTFSLMHGHGGMKICSRPSLLTLGTRLVHLLTSRPFSSTTSQIHVDRYKHSVYSHLSHEELSTVVTRDMSSTRFHACERFDRCEEVERLGKSAVYVNPAPIGSEDWSQYLNTTKEKLKHGEAVTSLVRRFTSCPISLSSYSSLALPCVETLAILGAASVREAL